MILLKQSGRLYSQVTFIFRKIALMGNDLIQRLRRFLIRFLTPLNKHLGEIYIAPKYREIKFHHTVEIFRHLKAGDVLLSYSRGELTNFFIDGEYKHCAIYDGDGHVIEAIGKGVRAVTVDQFCEAKDKIAVLRPMFCGVDVCISAVTIALAKIGTPYDYLFEPNEKAFYCAELVAYAYSLAMQGQSPFKPRFIMGINTILPIDFKNASTKFETILELPR